MQTVIIEHIVGDFELILGLDSFYRNKMKKYEEKLLPLIREILNKLNKSPEKFLVEGYYYETEKLTEYFNCIKTLKQVPIIHQKKIKKLPGYKKIIQLYCSGLYGEYKFDKNILPTVKDAIYYTLETLPVNKWNKDNILDTAYEIIKDTNNYSIINLGIILKNPVIITALRESVVLYSEFICTGAPPPIIYIHKYIWNVSKNIENMANIIIEIFNGICPYKIPEAIESNAELYYYEYTENKIDSRCVRIGFDDLSNKNYHWAIKNIKNMANKYKFIDFWDSELWTTEKLKNDYLQKEEYRKINWDIE